MTSRILRVSVKAGHVQLEEFCCLRRVTLRVTMQDEFENINYGPFYWYVPSQRSFIVLLSTPQVAQ